MAKTSTSLFVRSDAVTLVAAKGKRIVKWAEMPLEPGLVKDGVIADQQALDLKLKELYRSQGIRPRKITAAVSGLHSLTQTMVLPHVQKPMLAEAIKREAEMAFPVPAEQLYLSWQIVASTSETMHVFVAASPRNTVDSLVETLHLSRVKVHMLDLAPLALSRLAAGMTGVLADIRPTEVDIVVNVDGLPQLVRSQTYPAEAKTIQEKLLFVKEELEHAIDFYDTAHPDKPLDAVAFSGRLPVHVSGKLVQELAACQFLAGELNRSVLPVQSTLKAPHNFPATQFMVNVGLATKPSGEETGEFSGVNINLLPEAQRAKPFSFVRVGVAVGSVAAAAAAVLFSVMQVGAAGSETASLQKQLDAANAQFQNKFSAEQAQKQQAADFTQKVKTLQATEISLTAELNTLKSISARFDAQRQQFNAELALITTSMPPAVSLHLVDRSATLVAVHATSPDGPTVLAYARVLRQSGKFATVTVTSMQVTTAGSVDFTLTLEEQLQQ